MTKLHIIAATFCSILLLLSFSSNPPQGRTGGPGEQTCASIGCHSSVTPAFDGRIALEGLPDLIVPNTTYSLSFDMIVDRGNPERGGFQMMALDENEENIGMFSNPSESATLSNSNNRTYYEHDPAKNFDGEDTLSYTVDWLLPSDQTSSEVIFYAAANFANGNGGTSGDRISTLVKTFNVASTSNLNVLISSTSPSCPGGSDGAITLIPQDGVPPYSFSLDDLSDESDSSITFIELTAGSKTVVVSDANGLTFEKEVIIEEAIDIEPPLLTCLTDTLRIMTCNPLSYPLPTATDQCGDVTVRLIEGQGSNQSFLQGLNREIYEAVDKVGNTAQCTIYIENNSVLDFDFNIQNIPCAMDSFGSAELIARGSNLPFSVTSPDGDIDLSKLGEGDYNLIVTDNSGCQEEAIISIGRIDTLTLEVVEVKQPLTSSSGDGAIDINVEGGSPPYSFNWRTEDEMFSNDEDLNLLFPGEYTLKVQDINGCSIQSDTIRVDAITSAVNLQFSKGITIFPNPTSQFITTDHDDIEQIVRMEIFNLSGQKVMLLHEDFRIVNLQDMESGLYILKMIHKEGHVGTAKFQKL